MTTDARRSWWPALLGIAALGTIARAMYVLVVLRDVPPGFDATWYTLQGGAIRSGTGFVVPTTLFSGELEPTAAFPPAYPAYQAVWQALFGDGPDSVRIAGIVPALVTIVAAALVARRLVGPRAGLIAALVVAADPMLIAVDGSSMSENLSVPLVALAVLLALWMLDRPLSPVTLVPLGVVGGIGVLTRQDFALVIVLLFGGLLVLHRDRGATRRLAAGGAGLAVLAAVVVPWAVRNERALDTFTISTLSQATALAGANCDPTYSGASIGQWEFACVEAARNPGLTEPQQASHMQQEALDYVRDHPERLVLVVPARVLRVWGFWDPRDQIPREVVESRSERWQQLSWVTSLAIVLGGSWGLARLVRTNPNAVIVLAPVASVVVIAALSHGNTRFSAIAHPALAVGIGAAVVSWSRRLRRA